MNRGRPVFFQWLALPIFLAGLSWNAAAAVHVVVLDPGHGGLDVGNQPPGKPAEKELTLNLATAVKRFLEQKNGVRVILTRREDATLSTLERVTLANTQQAEVFVSFHMLGANAARKPLPAAMISRPVQDEELTRWERQKKKEGLNVVAWELAQNHFLEGSRRFGKILLQAWNRDASKFSAWEPMILLSAPLAPLAGANCPAVLLELPRLEKSGLFRPASRGIPPEMPRIIADAIFEFLQAEP